MVNSTDSRAIITTHSPYILTSLNILLYSDKIENGPKSKGTVVIAKNLRVNYKTFAAFKLENTRSGLSSMENLLDEESHMISTDYIDEDGNSGFIHSKHKKQAPNYVNLVKKLRNNYRGNLKIAEKQLVEKDIDLLK